MSDLAFYSGTFKTLRGLESLAQDTNDVWDIRWQRFSQSVVASVCAINKPWAFRGIKLTLYTFAVCFIYWRLCCFMHFMKCLFSKSVIKIIYGSDMYTLIKHNLLTWVCWISTKRKNWMWNYLSMNLYYIIAQKHFKFLK